MAEPLIARIEDAIVTALEAITTPIAVPSVTRPVRRGIDALPENYGIILTAEGGQPADEHSAPGNPPASARSQQFKALMILRIVPAATEPFTALGFRCLAAMAKALMADPQWTVDGTRLAIDTRLGDTALVGAEDGSFDGVELTFTVIYRTSEQDWTSQQ